MALIFCVVAVVALIAWLAVGRRRSTISFAMPRGMVLIFLALGVQALWIRWISALGPDAQRWIWLLPASYIPLLAFVWLNRRSAWIWVVAVGLTLNLVVMVANGGTMPTPARIASAPGTNLVTVTTHVFPHTKDTVVAGRPIELGLLADRFVIQLPGGAARIASVGDFIALAGCLLAIAEIFGVRVNVRQPLEAEGQHALSRRR